MAVHQARPEGEKLSLAWVGAGRMLVSGEYMGKEHTPENSFRELVQFIGGE